MASAAKIIGVLIFWGIIGIIWAVLNENVIQQIPTMFPEAVTQDAGAWEINLWIWQLSIILVAIGSAISILGDSSMPRVIAGETLIFTGLFMLIFIWGAFWQVTNVTLPSAFAAGFGTTSNEKSNLGVYDAAFQVGMLGLALVSLLVGGSVQIGGGGKRIPRNTTRGFISKKDRKALSDLAKKGRPQKSYSPYATRSEGGNTAVYSKSGFEGFRYD